MSRVSNSDAFSSNWHVLLGIATETFFLKISGIALLINDSIAETEHEAGTHSPKVIPNPLEDLNLK